MITGPQYLAHKSEQEKLFSATDIGINRMTNE